MTARRSDDRGRPLPCDAVEADAPEESFSDTPEESFSDTVEKAAAFAAAIVGLDADEAERQITEAGFVMRVIEVDGRARMGSSDLVSSRINVRIRRGKVATTRIG